MKPRTKKKQLRRLWDATAQLTESREYYHFIPARKRLSGKSAKRLIGMHYHVLGEYAYGWMFLERPKFRGDKRYIIFDEKPDWACDSYLRVARAEDNFALRKGYTERK